MPALPLDEAGKYVAAAYVVFVALLLIYVAIMATRLQRVERELGELADLAEEGRGLRPATDPAAEERRHDPSENPEGADAGADREALAVGEGQGLRRERSGRRGMSG